MNILLLSYDYPPSRGGIPRVSSQMASQLDRIGEKVIVVAQRARGGREFDKNNRFPTYRCINIFLLRELALLLLLPYIVLKYKVSTIYLLMWCQGGIATFLTSKLLGVPYVLHAHGEEFVDYKRSLLDKIKYSLLREKYKKLIFKNAKRIIAVSNFTKDIVVRSGAKEGSVDVIYNGVDINRFKPDMDTGEIILRHNLTGKRVLLTVSRLNDGYKGHDTIIKLMPQLLKEIPNIVYLIIGSGRDRDLLGSLVKELNLGENVIFTGYVDESSLPLYYNACDIFIMLTKEILDRGLFEGFGLTFLEANSCCKPVIGARTGGIPDAIVDGKTGYLVDPDNGGEVMDRIVSLLEDKGLSGKLGKEGRERIIREGLAWESIGKRVQDILKG